MRTMPLFCLLVRHCIVISLVIYKRIRVLSGVSAIPLLVASRLGHQPEKYVVKRGIMALFCDFDSC